MIEKKPFGLSGTALKLIACFTMAVDHVGAALFPQYISLRIIGRIAFPIFAFLLCQGMVYTKNVERYCLRLGLLALLSEPIFDILFWGKIELGSQNIFFTLLIGAVSIALCKKHNTWLWGMLGMIGAELTNANYGAAGLSLILMLYYANTDKKQISLYLAAFCAIYVVPDFILMTQRIPFNLDIQVLAIMALPVLLLYNGKRGGEMIPTAVMRWGFYSFYPLHLVAIWVIGTLFMWVK